MIIDHVQHAGWRVNSWLIAGREDGRGLILDTGADAAAILEMVRRHGVKVVGIISSHRHYDHVAGNESLAHNLDVPVMAHPLERPHIPTVTEEIEPGHTFEFSGWSAQVLHLPGHTAGQIGLYVPDVGVWTADALFKGSVGGNTGPGHTTFDDVKLAVGERLMSLPTETKVYPGHGDTTTIGHEKERNPFIRYWSGLDHVAHRPGRVDGKRVTIEVWAKDYDGGHKAQVRFADDQIAIVPGSKVQKVAL